MAGTTTTLSAITKTFYVSDVLNEQLNADVPLYDKLWKPGTKDVSGKNYTYAIRTARNRTVGRGISEGGAFGSPSNQGVENIVVPGTELTAGVELSTKVINAAKSGGKGAFVSALTLEVDGALKDFTRAINRQLHSDGTDALAFWTSADDTSGEDVDDGQGNAFIHLESGATTLDLIDATDHTTVLGDSIVVTKGAEAATSFAVTWTGTVSGSADGDYLVMEDSLGKQLMGIRGVISASNPPLLSGGLHGIAVSGNDYWKAQVYSNSGTNRDLTLELMQKPLTRIGTNSPVTEADVAFLMCNGPVKDKYIALLVAEQRQVNTTTLKGGQTSVEFNGKPIIVDPLCRRNTLYYIAPKTMDILTASGGIDWQDMDGDMWKMKTGSSGYSAAYQAFLMFDGGLAVKIRNGNAVLNDITE